MELISGPITWSIIKSKGINIIGPDRSALKFEVPTLHLVSYVLENMNSYWASRIQRVETSINELINLPTKEIDFEIEWSVLGLLRQYYTLKEHDIISKLGAGEYALQYIPEEWHNIIKEAINVRKGVKAKLFNSEEKRIESALVFTKYIICYCNNNLSKGQIEAKHNK